MCNKIADLLSVLNIIDIKYNDVIILSEFVIFEICNSQHCCFEFFLYSVNGRLS